jgi:predicted TIM-barrel fold metal-dependent hydrolase
MHSKRDVRRDRAATMSFSKRSARVLWGLDWPHVLQYKTMPNDGDLLDSLAEWVLVPELRARILVDNPAWLNGFD